MKIMKDMKNSQGSWSTNLVYFVADFMLFMSFMVKFVCSQWT